MHTDPQEVANETETDISHLKRKAVLIIDPALWAQYSTAISESGFVPVRVLIRSCGQMQQWLRTQQRSSIFIPPNSTSLNASYYTVVVAKENLVDCLEQLDVLADRAKISYSGCFSDTESGAEYSDIIAACLGLPHNDLTKVRSRRDKAEMKRALFDNGIRAASFLRCYSSDYTESCIKPFQGPFVVKTPSGTGTNQVYVCQRADEARAAIASILTSPDFFGHVPSFALVEEFLDGQEYAVNMMADGHVVSVTDIWRYDKLVNERGATEYVEAELLDWTQDERYRPIAQYCADVARAVGISIGPAHMEVRATRDGPVMIEIHPRVSGGDKPLITAMALPGWDPFKATVQAFTNSPVTFPKSLRPVRHARHLWFRADHHGVFEGISGLSDIEALPTFYRAKAPFRPGDVVRPTTDYFTYPLELLLVGDSAEEVAAHAELARRVVRVNIRPLDAAQHARHAHTDDDQSSETVVAASSPAPVSPAASSTARHLETSDAIAKAMRPWEARPLLSLLHPTSSSPVRRDAVSRHVLVVGAGAAGFLLLSSLFSRKSFAPRLRSALSRFWT